MPKIGLTVRRLNFDLLKFAQIEEKLAYEDGFIAFNCQPAE
jgi:hypothetical protein